MYCENIVTTESKKISNILNNHFTSTVQRVVGIQIDSIGNLKHDINDKIYLTPISATEILGIISYLKKHSAFRRQGISLNYLLNLVQ